MKQIIIGTLLLAITFYGHAQLNGVVERAKQKIGGKPVNKTANPTIDSTKTVTPKPETTKSDTTEPVKNNPPSFKAYSKYDFVPGEKVIGFEDFSTGNIGDFPAGWNTSGSAEIVTVEGKPGRWLWITKRGVYVPEFTDKYPTDFTFEFDLLHGVPIKGDYIHVVLAQLENVDQPQHWTLATNRFTAGLLTANTGSTQGTSSTDIRKNSISISANQIETDLLNDNFNPVHVSVWRQKERIRIYVNQEKIWDIPKAIAPEAKLNAILFSVINADADVRHYVSNIRLAVGAPDTRNKFLTESKWVTHGILFDVNSATIKPESFGSLKEIAGVLKENPGVKVKIIGHTDSDGKDGDNLDLSKLRAAAVKVTLAKEFGIDESRMETDGKGETVPIDKNDTPAGKANNRRVEFIKM